MDEVGFSEILSVMAETGSPECHILQQFLMSVQFFVLYFFSPQASAIMYRFTGVLTSRLTVLLPE